MNNAVVIFVTLFASVNFFLPQPGTIQGYRMFLCRPLICLFLLPVLANFRW